jgi:hypothetical protein
MHRSPPTSSGDLFPFSTRGRRYTPKLLSTRRVQLPSRIHLGRRGYWRRGERSQSRWGDSQGNFSKGEEGNMRAPTITRASFSLTLISPLSPSYRFSCSENEVPRAHRPYDVYFLYYYYFQNHGCRALEISSHSKLSIGAST